jgi:hypothetical protein
MRFCGACGHPLEKGVGPAAPDEAHDIAQRRHESVMFCDVVGLTPLAGQLDPEDFREVLSGYQQACARDRAIRDGVRSTSSARQLTLTRSAVAVVITEPVVGTRGTRRRLKPGGLTQARSGASAGLRTDRGRRPLAPDLLRGGPVARSARAR